MTVTTLDNPVGAFADPRFHTKAKPARSIMHQITNPQKTRVNASHIPSPRRTDFVNAMAHAVNGVSVVTTDGHAGRFGITVSSVSSVSADPPLVLACINRHSPACAAVQSNQVFCVNLLSTQQREVADTFAGRPAKGEPFDFTGVAWSTGITGAPHFRDAIAVFDCHLVEAYDAGSHTIFIGLVAKALGNGGDPLLYANRQYGSPCRCN